MVCDNTCPKYWCSVEKGLCFKEFQQLANYFEASFTCIKMSAILADFQISQSLTDHYKTFYETSLSENFWINGTKYNTTGGQCPAIFFYQNRSIKIMSPCSEVKMKFVCLKKSETSKQG